MHVRAAKVLGRNDFTRRGFHQGQPGDRAVTGGEGSDRYVQSERVRRSLCGDREGMSREVTDLTEAERARLNAVLDHLGIAYKGLNVLESADLRDGIKAYSNWPTIPQLYIKGEFVGGSDIMMEMYEAGELAEVVEQAGIARASSVAMKAEPI